MSSLSLQKPVRHGNVSFRSVDTSRRLPLAQRSNRFVVTANKSEDNNSIIQKMALPAAAVLGAALLFASTPDIAEAARSGGRMGGSSFSARPRAAPRAAPRSSGPSVRNYNYYSAPPLISPFGGYGFGLPFFGGGYGGGMTVVAPGFGLGWIFNLMFIMFAINIVLSVARSFTQGGDSNKKGNDSWDDEEPW